MANPRAKWSEIWYSGILVELLWDKFVMFKVILGSFGVLAIFLEIRFLHRSFWGSIVGHPVHLLGIREHLCKCARELVLLTGVVKQGYKVLGLLV